MTAVPPVARRVPGRALQGKRVLVMRAAHQASKLSDGLRALGAEPIEVPVLEIRPPTDFAPLDRALQCVAFADKTDRCPIRSAFLAERVGKHDPGFQPCEFPYNWLLLTSANTVRVLQERAQLLGIPLVAGPRLQVAAVGEATAAAARKAGLTVALVPERYVAESLVEALIKKAGGSDALKRHDFSRAEEDKPSKQALAPEGSLTGQRILLARAEIARDVIPDALRATGATVDVVDAYRNVMPTVAPELLRKALQKGIDAATFTSSSSVTHLAAAARAAGIAFPFAGVRAISIGPITSRTLRDHGWEPAAEARVSDISGLIDAISRARA